MVHIDGLKSARFRRLLKEGSWIVLGQVMAIVGALVGVRVITELLEPGEYGQLALGLTVATLVHQTIMGPITNGAVRFYAPAAEQADLGRYLKAVRKLLLFATIMISAVFLLTSIGLHLTGQTEWIVIAAVAFVLAAMRGCNTILSGIQTAARHRSVVALHQGIEPWVRFLIAAGLMMLLGTSSTVAMIGYSLGIILILASQLAFFRRLFPNSYEITEKGRNWRTSILNYSYPFSIWGLFTFAQLASDRWALEVFATTQDVGRYSVLFQLGYYPMSVAIRMAVQFLGPILFQRAGDGTDANRNASVQSLIWRTAAITMLVTGIGFFVALMFHAQIFRIFAAPDYAAVSHLLPWMLLGGGLFAYGQTISLQFTTQMRTQAMIAPKIGTALLGVALNFTGAYLFGITGVVVACILFSATYLVWMLWLALNNKTETV